MKRNSKKTLTKILSFGLAFSNILPVFAYDIPFDENGYSSEAIEYQNTDSFEFTSSSNVYAQLASIYGVTIPKTVVLSGATKDAGYFVKVEGDIAGYETLHVVPDDNFNLYTKNKDSQTATITQDKTAWKYDNFDTDANGLINAPSITAGAWKGTFNFNIFLEGMAPEEKVVSDIIIPEFLDADYRLIISKLKKEESGIYDKDANLITSFDYIKAHHNINTVILEGTEADNNQNTTTLKQVIETKYPQTSYVVLPNTVKEIKTGSLDIENVKYVEIPDSVTTIENNSFGKDILYTNIPKNIKTVNDSVPTYYNGKLIQKIVIDLENSDTADITLEKGYTYQIEALYNFKDDVTGQSTIKSSNEEIVLYRPVYFIDALEVGNCTLSGTYNSLAGKKFAKINVKVIDTHKHVIGEMIKEDIAEPTCTEKGHYKANYYCTICNKLISSSNKGIPLKPHTESDWKIIKEPTCLDKGTHQKSCIVCGKITETESIPALGHNFVDDVCTRCGRVKEYVAGVYDENWEMIYSWDELQDLGFDIQSDSDKSYHGHTFYNTIPYKDRKKAKHLVIPDSVTYIGIRALKDCEFETVKIPNSVKNIGAGAFSGCKYLKTITIPDSMTRIEKGVFGNCSMLESVTIPNTITYIGPEAFYGTALVSITFPNKITIIEQSCFAGCTSLKSIVIPDSVTKINYEAFTNCSSLETMTIGSSVNEIQYPFKGCSALKSVTFKNTNVLTWKVASKTINISTDPAENAQIVKTYAGSRWYLKK